MGFDTLDSLASLKKTHFQAQIEEETRRTNVNTVKSALSSSLERLKKLQHHKDVLKSLIQDQENILAQNENSKMMVVVSDNNIDNLNNGSPELQVCQLRKHLHRDTLAVRLSEAEERLKEIRNEINIASQALSSHVDIVCTCKFNLQGQVSESMKARNNLMNLQQELVFVEKEYIMALNALGEWDKEHQGNDSSILNDSFSENLPESSTSRNLFSSADDEHHNKETTLTIALKSKASVDGIKNDIDNSRASCCSLDEMIERGSRIPRLSGESPFQYQKRLLRRFQSIQDFIYSVKEEIEGLSRDLQIANDQLKDAELKKLRYEVQVSRMESAILNVSKSNQVGMKFSLEDDSRTGFTGNGNSYTRKEGLVTEENNSKSQGNNRNKNEMSSAIALLKRDIGSMYSTSASTSTFISTNAAKEVLHDDGRISTNELLHTPTAKKPPRGTQLQQTPRSSVAKFPFSSNRKPTKPTMSYLGQGQGDISTPIKSSAATPLKTPYGRSMEVKSQLEKLNSLAVEIENHFKLVQMSSPYLQGPVRQSTPSYRAMKLSPQKEELNTSSPIRGPSNGLIQSLDDADDLDLNYLRSVLDTIAGQQVEVERLKARITAEDQFNTPNGKEMKTEWFVGDTPEKSRESPIPGERLADKMRRKLQSEESSLNGSPRSSSPSKVKNRSTQQAMTSMEASSLIFTPLLDDNIQELEKDIRCNMEEVLSKVAHYRNRMTTCFLEAMNEEIDSLEQLHRSLSNFTKIWENKIVKPSIDQIPIDQTVIDSLKKTANLTLDELQERFEHVLDEHRRSKREERIHPTTKIALDDAGNSLAKVYIMVVSARNLPVTKTMSKSADTYVEVSLNSLFTENAAEGEGAEELLQEDVCNNHVNACTRSSTTTQFDTLFPTWRETIELHPVKDLFQYIIFAVKQNSRLGPQHDKVIGWARIPLAGLTNQQKQSFWLDLKQPSGQQVIRRIPPNCGLKVEVKLFFSKTNSLKMKIELLQKMIFLRTFYNNATNPIFNWQKLVLNHRALVELTKSNQNTAPKSTSSPNDKASLLPYGQPNSSVENKGSSDPVYHTKKVVKRNLNANSKSQLSMRRSQSVDKAVERLRGQERQNNLRQESRSQSAFSRPVEDSNAVILPLQRVRIIKRIDKDRKEISYSEEDLESSEGNGSPFHMASNPNAFNDSKNDENINQNSQCNSLYSEVIDENIQELDKRMVPPKPAVDLSIFRSRYQPRMDVRPKRELNRATKSKVAWK